MFDNIEHNEYIVSKRWRLSLAFTMSITLFIWLFTLYIFTVPETSVGPRNAIMSLKMLDMLKSMSTLLFFVCPFLVLLEWGDGMKYKVVHYFPKEHFKVRVYHNMYHVSYKDYAWALTSWEKRKFERDDRKGFVKAVTYHTRKRTMRQQHMYW